VKINNERGKKMKTNNLKEAKDLGVISKEFKAKIKIIWDLQLKVPS
jgi:hypothetical protein